uniref:Uncharacterized protein n=1 Tax=Plectus sambesii TaxID=2011161 RepID=A0A914XDT8_9BILA
MSNDEQNDSVFNRFCENVSIPTAKYLTAKHNRKVRIMTWILIIVMAALTVYQIYERSAYYSSKPITVVVTESNQDSGVMPAMVICPPGQFRASFATARVYGRDYFFLGDSMNSDLFSFEQHRDTFISNFRRANISFTNSDIDTLLQELNSIYEDLNNAPDEELSKILDRLDNMSTSLQDRFPMLASKLSTKEPISKGIIPLKGENTSSITDADGYAYYRALNGLYDYCTTSTLRFAIDEFSLPDWNRAIRDIMKCRIGGDSGSDETIKDLTRFSTYPRLINLARPNLTDIVLDCKWFNSEFSSSRQECNVTSVWTPFGQCFRIAPLEGTNLSLSTPETNVYVDVLIDTLTAEFPDALPKVYFYSQNETEFAITNGGISIEPGLKSNLMIEQMRQNTRAAKNCGTTYLKHFKSYSKDKCIWEKVPSLSKRSATAYSHTYMNRIIDYFGFYSRTSSSHPLLPFDFDETLFDQTGEQYSFFVELITSILEKYNTSQKGWTYSYSKESMEPFYNLIIADLEAAKSATDQFAELRLLVLNKFVEEYTKFYECVTSSQQTPSHCYASYGCTKRTGYDETHNISYIYCLKDDSIQQLAEQVDSNRNTTNYWIPISICDLEQALKNSNATNTSLSPIQELKHWIETFLQPRSDIDDDFSVWQAPWGVYAKWFRKEMWITSVYAMKSIAQALSIHANISDSFAIVRNYGDGSVARENLKQVLVDVANAMESLYSPLGFIMGCIL